MNRIGLIGLLTICTSITNRCAAQDFALTMHADKSHLALSNCCVFDVTITNITAEPRSIINWKRREVLKPMYFALQLRRGGDVFDFPNKLIDPGPVDASDWLELEPHGGTSFRITNYSIRLTGLKAGEYEAVLRFMPNPFAPDTNSHCFAKSRVVITK